LARISVHLHGGFLASKRELKTVEDAEAPVREDVFKKMMEPEHEIFARLPDVHGITESRVERETRWFTSRFLRCELVSISLISFNRITPVSVLTSLMMSTPNA
jgi:hypothetical protein